MTENKRITIEVDDSNGNYFDRQQRIVWWSQDLLSRARIMVVGAGAIGNETLKNLALLGARNLFIVDFDTISPSNLSRTVLFRPQDHGRGKAEVAAERTRQLCLAGNPNVDWFHGDLVWELGTGLYKAMDLVLVCVDNVEARLAVNRHCWLGGTPWIDSGVNELGLHVTLFMPPHPPCYECTISSRQRESASRRYSCDNFKRAAFQEDVVPTVQLATSLASALQVQEAMKVICERPAARGKSIYFQGTTNDFDLLELQANPQCTAHGLSYPDVVELPVGTNTKLRELLGILCEEQHSGAGATLDFRGEREFVASAACRSCGNSMEFRKPSFRIVDTDLYCGNCRENGGRRHDPNPNEPSRKSVLSEFNLQSTSNAILEMSLRDLGVAYWPILAVCDRNQAYKYYELSGDKDALLPAISKNWPIKD
jgi:adenylyltransferase/sulfurtransferase